VSNHEIREHLASVRQASSEMGISTAERLAAAAEALLSMQPVSHDAEMEVMDTIHRSVDVVSLLIHDAGRRRQGYPPAALHEAVFTLMEQMERLRPGVVRERTH
jgi:hypothetical protein